MKKLLVLVMVLSSSAFAQSVDTFWGIDKKMKKLTTSSRLYKIRKKNKDKANKKMDALIETAEKGCVEAGWKFTLVSRKDVDYIGNRKHWTVNSVVTCER